MCDLYHRSITRGALFLPMQVRNYLNLYCFRTLENLLQTNIKDRPEEQRRQHVCNKSTKTPNVCAFHDLCPDLQVLSY
jgi:hypothetical protein